MVKRIVFISLFILVGLSLVFGVDSIWAKYPEKKIRFVAAFAPGGGSDLVARTLAKYVNPYLDNRVYVENVVGAGGAIGFREGAKASPDGYTLTMIVTGLTVSPHVVKDFPSYDLFDPICIVAQDPMILTVGMENRFKTIQDLIFYAKVNPGRVSVSTAGVGSVNHLEIAAFADAIGAQFNIVPFKGSNPALVGALGGHVDVATSGCSEAISLVEGKKLRPLVVFGTKRSRLYPDVPTARELGYEVVIYMWRGVGVPKGTPKEVKAVLVEAFRRTMEDEECKKFMDQIGLERIYLGSEEAAAWLKAQNDFFKNVVTKIGLKPE
jgi:tripartite-type tricarboxylate transporter receptor subunit TctC